MLPDLFSWAVTKPLKNIYNILVRSKITLMNCGTGGLRFVTDHVKGFKKSAWQKGGGGALLSEILKIFKRNIWLNPNSILKYEILINSLFIY